MTPHEQGLVDFQHWKTAIGKMHKVLHDDSEDIIFEYPVSDSRAQNVVFHFIGEMIPGGTAWMRISTPVGKSSEISAEQILDNETPVGHLVRDGDLVMLCHPIQITNLLFENLREVYQLMGQFGDILEQRFADGQDRY